MHAAAAGLAPDDDGVHADACRQSDREPLAGFDGAKGPEHHAVVGDVADPPEALARAAGHPGEAADGVDAAGRSPLDERLRSRGDRRSFRRGARTGKHDDLLTEDSWPALVN